MIASGSLSDVDIVRVRGKSVCQLDDIQHAALYKFYARRAMGDYACASFRSAARSRMTNLPRPVRIHPARRHCPKIFAVV